MNDSTGEYREISRETQDLQRFIERYSTINREINGDADVPEFARESLKRIYNDEIPFSDFSRLLDAYYDASKKEISQRIERGYLKVCLEDLIICTDDTLDSIKETGKSVDDALSLINNLSQNTSFDDLSGEVIESLKIKYAEEKKNVQGKCEHTFREDGEYCPKCGIKQGLESSLDDDKDDKPRRFFSVGDIFLGAGLGVAAYSAFQGGC